ncbi:similar to RNA binding protein gene with multiple splicing (predicted), isoform CRA_b [Rattus norvegicus]|uniref:Similar to RNA binding protein gene with multiple splicing (Predicted), isoform CRA_b n=1 Tax=Rattus norvegicus TaxID=10116 RepID=A6IVS1_RAT|nr:similar to RNA binding protein gene with multiple splicing (predicted), isoform CRA_b [Rattus norvegicus]EDM09156.1 similar to RNA binding protein gene with multiple splicing (predicted), isoform CRA_b [Rattus norvegicus]
MCDEHCYPCFKTSSKPKVSLVLCANTFPEAVMAVFPLLKRAMHTTLTSEFPAADTTRHNHNLCIFVIDLLVLC